MRGGAGPPESDGVLVEALPSEDISLNLILYMFAYSSNILKASFDRMDSMLARGTLKNLKFFCKSCSFSESVPAMKLTCFTTHPWGPSDLSSADFSDSYCYSAVSFARER